MCAKCLQSSGQDVGGGESGPGINYEGGEGGDGVGGVGSLEKGESEWKMGRRDKGWRVGVWRWGRLTQGCQGG